MILPDVNILLYAYNDDAIAHERSRIWLKSIMEGDLRLCLSWHTIMGFLRISTSVSIFPKPYSPQDALEIVHAWIDSPTTLILQPGERHLAIFERLVAESRIIGAKLMDAHIAALALEHGAKVATADRDFRLFDGLKTINPLVDR